MPDQPTYGDRTRDAAIFDAGRQRGLREATEGLNRVWGTRVGDGHVEDHASERSARRWAAGDHGVPVEVVSRLVGPWEPAEQPEPAPSPEDVADRPCPRCGGPAITHYADASTPAEPFALVPSRIECRDGCGTDVRDAEPAHGGTVATQAVQVCARCGVRQRNDDNPEFCWGCGYGETVATQEPEVQFDDSCDYDAWGADFGEARGANCINGDPAHRRVHHPEPAVHAEGPKPPADTSWIRTTEGGAR